MRKKTGPKPKDAADLFVKQTIKFHPKFVELMDARPSGMSKAQWLEEGRGFNRDGIITVAE